MTDSTPKPNMASYGRHVFICINGNCAPSDVGEQLREHFMALNRAHDLNKIRNPERVKCTLSDCLGVCSSGPIMTVYPDGIWYHQVDEAALERIFHSHILGGQPVEDLIFHRLYPTGDEPGYAPELRGEQGLWEDVEQKPGGVGVLESKGIGEKRNEGVRNEDVEEKERTEVRELGDDNAAERRALVRRAKKKKGLVIVNTGDGKGKTTASLGVMTRAWGRNMKVGMIQFLKNENARFGEIRAAEKMGVDWISTGDGWTWTSGDMDETAARAQHAWQVAQDKIVNGGYDVFIMDEFTYPLHYGWLEPQAIIDWLRENKPPMQHLIITGRNAPLALIDFADLVTEMREVKHPFSEQGIRAQPGIEY